MLMR
jgi:hypothetical protein